MLSNNKLSLIYHLGGSVVSRALPILFGLYLSRVYGVNSYAIFVEILVACNLVTSLSTMGFSSQLVVADYSDDRKYSSFKIGVITLVTFTALFGLAGFYGSNIVFGVLFNIGSGLSLITVSLLNGKLKFKEAFWFWLVLFAVQFLGLAFIYFFGGDLISVLNNFAILYLVTAIIFVVFYEGKNIYVKYSRFENTKLIISDALKLGLFGSIFMIGYNLLFKVMEGSDAEKAVFALGYQLFSLVIFLPSILGSYIVPLISSGTSLNQYSNIKKILILKAVYGVTALIIIVFILALFKNILEMYKINYEQKSFVIIFLVLFAGFICSISTGVVHINNSLKRFKILTYSSFIWLFVMGIYVFIKYLINGYYQLTVFECALVFTLSYISYFLFFIVDFYIYSRK